MKKIISALFALSIFASPASATGIVTCGGGSCLFVDADLSASPHIITLNPLSTPEAIEHDKRWVAFCHPTLSAPDDLGVQHYLYAHKGCEYGREQ